MDIIIKSFNRPYYLNRCLYSINKFVKNFEGEIYVLDDGTPQIYLDKIIQLFPNIILKKSEFYEQKQHNALNGICPNTYNIPINLWVNACKNASENFILIEDDTWFIDVLDIVAVEKEIIENKVVITKLFWLGNPKLNQNKGTVKKDNIVLLKPKLYTIIPALYYVIFYKFNRFKIRKILKFLSINTEEKRLAYYTIYAVAGMIFNKNYYSKLWHNHDNKVDEGLQLYNALKYYFKNYNNVQFARYNHEILRTGFISSATNQHKEDYDGKVDMFVFNKILNDAWLNDHIDVINSMPNDINPKEIITILDSNPQNRISSKDWLAWVESFKNYYLDIGCKID